ncbi:MAG: hypothetical protein JO042_17965 [Sinobacteraceae bacterium]|nr:hypothetical protein [Nevskiaceae bacterium]
MSNVIEFLEQMGRDANLRYVTGLELEAALTQAGIEPNLQAAILDGDQRLLESLVGASHNICCMINPPEEEEEHEEDEDEDHEEEEEDGGDDEE